MRSMGSELPSIRPSIETARGLGQPLLSGHTGVIIGVLSGCSIASRLRCWSGVTHACSCHRGTVVVHSQFPLPALLVVTREFQLWW